MKSCRASSARPQSHFWARTRRDQSIAVRRRLPGHVHGSWGGGGHGRGDRVCKVRFGHVMRLCSASKRRGIRAQATTWMNHEAVLLRGISLLRRAHGSGLEPSSHRQAAMGVTRPQGPDGQQEAGGAGCSECRGGCGQPDRTACRSRPTAGPLGNRLPAARAYSAPAGPPAGDPERFGPQGGIPRQRKPPPQIHPGF